MRFQLIIKIKYRRLCIIDKNKLFAVIFSKLPYNLGSYRSGSSCYQYSLVFQSLANSLLVECYRISSEKILELNLAQLFDIEMTVQPGVEFRCFEYFHSE